jgi:glycosyltransferase involved in cell wall biosynthesis
MVSVLIPAFNAGRFLAEALDSVLAQTHPAAEVIVLNDGSTDDTAAVAARYAGRIRCEEQENRGIRAARERLLALAAGEWIAFLDADDIWHPEKTARQLAEAAAHPDAEFIYCDMIRFHDGPAGRVTHAPEAAPLASGSLVHRAALARTGGFCGPDQVGEFLEWLLRAREVGLRERRLPEALFWRRRHEGNIGVIARAAEHQAYLRALRAALSRRRNPPP